jgi:hypothetical protein
MNKRQLAHIVRAAAAITGERIFVVVGSQAILAQFPDAPEGMLWSNEADIYPLDRPDLADDIDGAIGELSHFHEQFGYYAEGVGPETAKLPEGWEQRAYRLQNAETEGAAAICPEIHDLAASKLIAGREKDVEWVQQAFDAGFIQADLLETRLYQTAVAAEFLVRAVGHTRGLAAPRGE